MKEQKDIRLWRQAKERAGFKAHFTTYVIVNASLWLTWLFTGGVNRHPWPIWLTIGWGIGIISNYLSAYRFSNTAEKEYEKLTKDDHYK